MTVLVTGSAGHLGEAIMRTLRSGGRPAIGLDSKDSVHTDRVGTIEDRALVRQCMKGVDAVLHTATLHKPHVATHTRQQFVDTNITGTLNLLEEAVAADVRAFVFTSTTSVFGDALGPGEGEPAIWVTEALTPRPKNIYGVTKLAAESLCRLFHRNQKLPCLVLRTSRFFPEDDDDRVSRQTFDSENLKTNEFLNRRADLADVVSAHLVAAERAPAIGFGRYIISATTPFLPEDLAELRTNAPAVVERRLPGYAAEYRRRGWRMPQDIGRVYVNALARKELGWNPTYDFAAVLEQLRRDEPPGSSLARAVGSKGYHEGSFAGEGPYPVE